MTDPTPRSPFLDRARFLGIGLAIGLVTGGAGAGWVWWQGQAEVAEIGASAARAADDAKGRESELKTALDAEKRQVAILSARAGVARARAALDAQNFGLVREHLQGASQALGGVAGQTDLAGRLGLVQVDPAVPGSTAVVLDGLAAELDALVGT
jgi:hypothetical protein